MPANSAKVHLCVEPCGRVDISKSTTTVRLYYVLGCLPETVQEKLKEEAFRLAKGSIVIAFYMDRQKEELVYGVTSACTTQVFYTVKRHCTVVIADNMGWRKDSVNPEVAPKVYHTFLEFKAVEKYCADLLRSLSTWACGRAALSSTTRPAPTAAPKSFAFFFIRVVGIAIEMKCMLVKFGRKKNFVVEACRKTSIII